VAGANRAGGQFGFEQPLNKKLSLAADWFTGKHSAGYFTPGLVFQARVKSYRLCRLLDWKSKRVAGQSLFSARVRLQLQLMYVRFENFERSPMLDVLFIAITIVFFLIALAYVRGCEKLQ